MYILMYIVKVRQLEQLLQPQGEQVGSCLRIDSLIFLLVKE